MSDLQKLIRAKSLLLSVSKEHHKKRPACIMASTRWVEDAMRLVGYAIATLKDERSNK